jgi:recombination protein RecA
VPKRTKGKSADEPPPRRTRSEVDALLSSLNKKFGGEKGRATIRTGAEIQWEQATRISTGSVGLDVALNGGLPKGMVVQYFGDESSGKSTLALKACVSVQQLYGPEACIGWIAVEPFDKQWANLVGVHIPFTKGELKLMRPQDQQRYANVRETGRFVVASAISGEDALQIAYEMIASGVFHLVVLDSIAALQPMAEVEKEMDEKTMGQLPRLVGQFLKKCYSAFNSELASGQRNETAVILINQVREKIGGYGHPEPEPPGGRALRHACGATVRFKKGEVLRAKKEAGDEESSKGRAYGRRTKLRVEKSKIGPPYREAEFDFYFDDEGRFGPGDIDVAQELRRWGIHAGLILQPTNTKYVLGKRAFTGKGSIEKHLAENPDAAEELRRGILKTLTTADVE